MAISGEVIAIKLYFALLKELQKNNKISMVTYMYMYATGSLRYRRHLIVKPCINAIYCHWEHETHFCTKANLL